MKLASISQNPRTQDADFEKLYNRFYKPGILFLSSIIKDREEAENMLQDVFIKIWLRREKLELNTSLQPYIFTSLKNIAFDYLKKMERDEDLKKRFFENMKDSSELAENTEDSVTKIISNALGKLTEKRKMIVRLNIEEGKSYQEIAQIMSISKNTVKNQLIKAKQHLRGIIEYPLVIE